MLSMIVKNRQSSGASGSLSPIDEEWDGNLDENLLFSESEDTSDGTQMARLIKKRFRREPYVVLNVCPTLLGKRLRN